MKDEAAFLEAIRATEDSDAREVYADWLEEQGRSEYAEYVRLEIEVRGFEFVTGNEDRERKKARHDELAAHFKKSDPMWLDDVVRTSGGWVTRPRPTTLGRAQPIEPSASRTSAGREPQLDPMLVNLSPGRSPTNMGEMPELPKPRWSWSWGGRTILLEIAVALALAFAVTHCGHERSQAEIFWDYFKRF